MHPRPPGCDVAIGLWVGAKLPSVMTARVGASGICVLVAATSPAAWFEESARRKHPNVLAVCVSCSLGTLTKSTANYFGL